MDLKVPVVPLLQDLNDQSCFVWAWGSFLFQANVRNGECKCVRHKDAGARWIEDEQQEGSNPRIAFKSIHLNRGLLVTCGDYKDVSFFDISSLDLIKSYRLSRRLVSALGATECVIVADKFGDVSMLSDAELEAANKAGERMVAYFQENAKVAAARKKAKGGEEKSEATPTIRAVPDENQDNDDNKNEIDTHESMLAMIGCMSTITAIEEIKFPKGGHLLALGDKDEKIRVTRFPDIFDMKLCLLGHTLFITCIMGVVAGGEELIISGSADGTLRIWDSKVGRLLQTIPLKTAPLLLATASAGGINTPPLFVACASDSSVKCLKLGLGETHELQYDWLPEWKLQRVPLSLQVANIDNKKALVSIVDGGELQVTFEDGGHFSGVDSINEQIRHSFTHFGNETTPFVTHWKHNKDPNKLASVEKFHHGKRKLV